MNETARKFGDPDNRLADLEHWVVLLRPAQVTLGSLVLVCKDEAARFGEISAAASAELGSAAARIESVLGQAFANDKINYLMLMMVDPDVHFHVIPRYDGEREYAGERFADAFWPGPPDITHRMDVDEAVFQRMIQDLRVRFG